jgi:hypothetical protein
LQGDEQKKRRQSKTNELRGHENRFAPWVEVPQQEASAGDPAAVSGAIRPGGVWESLCKAG